MRLPLARASRIPTFTRFHDQRSLKLLDQRVRCIVGPCNQRLITSTERSAILFQSLSGCNFQREMNLWAHGANQLPDSNCLPPLPNPSLAW
jgi:hypothetical protein